MTGLGFLLAAVTATPLVPWWAGRRAGTWNRPTGETLIVLAGSALDDGVLGASSYTRAVRTVRVGRIGGRQ
jgi:hypothetical protein